MGDRAVALKIATEDLRSCYGHLGIMAGTHHFSDYWARDAVFACFGALSLGDYEIVRKTLSTFFSRIRNDGLLPFRIGQKNIYLKLIGVKSQKIETRFLDDKAGNEVIDQNALLLILLEKYVEKTKDKKFLALAYENCVQAFHYLEKHTDADTYLQQGAYADWLDSIDRSGASIYCNILFWRSCKSMLYFANRLKKKQKKYYARLEKNLRESIITLVQQSLRTRFEADGILLGLSWGFFEKEAAKKLLSKLEEHRNDWRLLPAYPAYSASKVNKMIRLSGMREYHRSMLWLWLYALEGLGRLQYGDKGTANSVADTITGIINAHKHVYEIYDSKFKPVRKLLYKSEMPFAWSAGLTVLFLSEFKLSRS